jgi:hypothetical protein
MRGHFRWPRFITRREKPSRRRQEPPIGDAGECRGTYEGAGKAFEQSLFLLPGGATSGPTPGPTKSDHRSDVWSDADGAVGLLGSEAPKIGDPAKSDRAG